MRRPLVHSGRRAFLRGAGGFALGLPLLEYTHGHLWAGGVASPRRFVVCFEHGGTISNQATGTGTYNGGKHDGSGGHHGEDWWRPADLSSSSLVLGPILAGLEPWRQRLVQLESVDNKAATRQDPYGQGGHGISNATVLTCADVEFGETGDDSVPSGPSIDQVVAERLAVTQPVPFSRIHLMVTGHHYGSPFYRGASEQTYGEESPAAAFASIFAGVSGGELTAGQLRQLAMRGSMLGGLLEGYERARGKVSARDLQVIEAHLEHLHALEQEIMNPVVCTPPEGIDADANAGGDVVGPLHARLIVAALRCGLTNVANLEIADILTPWTPAGLQVESGYGIGHSLGHYSRDVGPEGAYPDLLDPWLAEMLDNRRWRMSLVAAILEGLDDPAFPEGDGTMLDNSLVLCTSEFRDPATHVAHNAPVLLAGSAGGTIETGRFIDYNTYAADDPNTLEYESHESLHNLYTSILQSMGGDDEHFGSDHVDHQGPIPGLLS
ncbi:MAG: DUF1552 domain-containing protein [Deltaproteobacteria bacterium]|nr:DUF1552 domain-containing protein [Nannocystaceae bacterium]